MVNPSFVCLSLCELGERNEYGCEVLLDRDRRKIVIREHKMPPWSPDWVHRIEIDVDTLLSGLGPNDKDHGTPGA